MNIFILDVDPELAARSMCNKHVVKMVLESAQLLSTAFPKEIAPYKHTHFNHPCAKWVRESLANYKWLVLHAIVLCEEYTLRYGKVHKTEEKIDECAKYVPNIPDVGLTPFARAIKEPFKSQTSHLSIVEAYRAYYIADKARFAKWEPRSRTPDWWIKVNE